MAPHMVKFSVRGTEIRLSYLFAVLLTAFALTDDSGLWLWSLLFSLFHECGHILAVLLCRGHIRRLDFQPFGIAMFLDGSDFSRPQEVFILSAGCLVNLIGACCCQGSYRVIQLMIFGFNALPIGTLDGGRLSELLLIGTFGEKRGRIAASLLSFFLLGALSALGFYALFRYRRPSLLITAAYLCLTLMLKKEKLCFPV